MLSLLTNQACLLLLAIVATILGGKALMGHPARAVVTFAWVYSVVGTSGYSAAPLAITEPVTVFRWGLDPLIPALMVYLGLGLCLSLLLGAVSEWRQKELRMTAMRRGAVVLLYVSTVAAVILTLRIPIVLQGRIDQYFAS